MKKIHENLLVIISLMLISFGTYAQEDSIAFVAASDIEAVDNIQKLARIETFVGSNLLISGDWTIEAWINIGVHSSSNSIVEAYSSGNTGGFVLRVVNGNLKAYQIFNTSSAGIVTDTAVLDTDVWYHVAATLDETSDELKIYVNGVLHGSTSTTISTNNRNDYLRIGSLGDLDKVHGKTSIDEVRIWNEAKTETEIQALADSCLVGNESNLLAWYDFEDVVDQVLQDKSENSNNGTFVNYNSLSFTDRIFSCADTSETVGLVDQSAEFHLITYPNPVKHILNIALEEQIESITVMNVKGQVEKISNPTNHSLDVSQLTSGMYFLLIQTEFDLLSSKFIKE